MDYRFVVSKTVKPSESEILDDDEKRRYGDVLRSLAKLPTKVRHFPGTLPVSLSRTSTSLSASDYQVTPKVDGVRFMLLLTTRTDTDGVGGPVALLVDRAGHMFKSGWGCEAFFTEGTLLTERPAGTLPARST